MTLDDIARACTAAFNDTNSPAHTARENARKLAGYLVAFLPVVETGVALADIDTPGEMSPMGNAYRVIEHGRREAALIKAVDVMQQRLTKLKSESTR